MPPRGLVAKMRDSIKAAGKALEAIEKRNFAAGEAALTEAGDAAAFFNAPATPQARAFLAGDPLW